MSDGPGGHGNKTRNNRVKLSRVGPARAAARTIMVSRNCTGLMSARSPQLRTHLLMMCRGSSFALPPSSSPELLDPVWLPTDEPPTDEPVPTEDPVFMPDDDDGAGGACCASAFAFAFDTADATAAALAAARALALAVAAPAAAAAAAELPSALPSALVLLCAKPNRAWNSGGKSEALSPGPCVPLPAPA